MDRLRHLDPCPLRVMTRTDLILKNSQQLIQKRHSSHPDDVRQKENMCQREKSRGRLHEREPIHRLIDYHDFCPSATSTPISTPRSHFKVMLYRESGKMSYHLLYLFTILGKDYQFVSIKLAYHLISPILFTFHVWVKHRRIVRLLLMFMLLRAEV